MKCRWPSAQAWWNFLIAAFTGLLTLFTLWQYQLSRNAAGLDVAFLTPTEPRFDEDKGILTMFVANYGKEVSGTGAISMYCAIVRRDDLTIDTRGGIQRHPLVQIPPFEETGPHVLPTFSILLVPWSADKRKSLENNEEMIVIMGRIDYDNRREFTKTGFCFETQYFDKFHAFVWNQCDKSTISKLRSEEEEIERQQRAQNSEPSATPLAPPD